MIPQMAPGLHPGSDGALAMKIEIHRPCTEPLARMRGPNERLHCDRCQQHVHNLSMLSVSEAHALLRERGDAPLCIRVTHASDGTPRFRDLVPAASLTHRIVVAGIAASLLTASGALAASVVFERYGGYDPPRVAPTTRDVPGQALVDIDSRPAAPVTSPSAPPPTLDRPPIPPSPQRLNNS